MKLVKATKRGFFGKLREIGDVFAVPDGFKASWASRSAEADAKIDADGNKEPTQADKSIDDLLTDLDQKSDADLQNMLDAEIAGKKRKGLIAKIGDEIDNRAKLLS